MTNNYDYIVNPKTKRKVRINTNLGKSILKKYQTELFGGGCEFKSEEKEHFSSYEYKCILEQLKIRDDFRKEEINKLRNKTVKISSDETNLFINEEKLPWPGFFIGHELKKDNYNLVSYEVLDNIYFCKINGIEMSVPYNSNFFTFNDGELSLLDSSLTV